jgi:cholesterol transport system auxiliary component
MKAHDAALRSRRNLLVASAALLTLGGCSGGLGSLLGASNPLQLYRLQPHFSAPASCPRATWQLAVARPDTARSLDTERIALVRGETMDYYADAQWTDAVPRLVQSLLIEAFEESGCLPGVARESDKGHSDYTLETEIREFSAQYEQGDGAPLIVVEIEARLLTAKGEVAAMLQAKGSQRARQNAVTSVVEAFDAACGKALDEIVAWVLSAPRPEAKGT